MTDAKSIASERSFIDRPSVSILDDIEEIDLQQRLEKIQHEIIELTQENNLFETTLERKRSESVLHQSSVAAPPSFSASQSATTTPNDTHHDVPGSSATNRSERGARKRSRSRSTQSDMRIQLTLEQKLDIVTSEYELLVTDKIRRETLNGKKFDQFQSDLEWIDGEITDCELALTDFLKIRDNSIDKRTHKLMGEKLDRYFHERLKGRDSLTNRLRDRSIELKRQIIRLDNRIKQNEEIGDSLQEVDFTQLKIENKQYLDKIDEKNVELVSLKRQVSEFTQKFNYYKDRLQRQTQVLIDLEKRIEKQQYVYEHLQRDLDIVNNEHSHATKRHSYLLEQSTSYRVPEIIDYVRAKALLYNLQRECEVWQRKIEIVSMGLQQAQQKWRALQQVTRYSYDSIY